MDTNTSQFVVDNKAKIFKIVFSSLLIIVCTGLLGAWNWVSLGFSLEKIKTTEYWIHVAVRSVCLICMYQVGVNLFLDRMKEKSKTLKAEADTYEQLSKLRDVNFSDYIEKVLNRSIKKEAYKNKMLKKIHRLDKRAKDSEKLLFLEPDPEAEVRIGRKLVKKKDNRYCIRKQEILDLIKDENLDKNIDTIRIKYQHVEASAFDLDISGNVRINSYKVKSRQASSTLKAICSALVFMIPAGMVASSLAPGINQGNMVSSIMNCVMDVGFCLWQLIRGIMFCNTLLNSEYILPYSNRNRILKMYINWNKDNEKSPSKKILDYIEASNQIN